MPQLLSVFSIWTGAWSSSCRKLPPEQPHGQEASPLVGQSCPSAVNQALLRPGRELSFAAELPGKEFPATADPSPKTAFQGITLSPSPSSAFPSKSLAWGHFCSNRSRADPWEHPGLGVGVFQVHSSLSAWSIPSCDTEPVSAVSLGSTVLPELWMPPAAGKTTLSDDKNKW